MENSFFEFRNDTEGTTISNSDDVIDDSRVEDESFTILRKHTPKNKTVAFIAESTDDEDSSDGKETPQRRVTSSCNAVSPFNTSEAKSDLEDSPNDSGPTPPKSATLVCSSDEECSEGEETPPRQITPTSDPVSSFNTTCEAKSDLTNNSETNSGRTSKSSTLICSSEDENVSSAHNTSSRRKSHRTSTLSDNVLICSSSDEELKPIQHRRKSKLRSLDSKASSDSSFIGRKKGKACMVLRDSDTDDMTPDDELVMSAATRMSIIGVRPRDMPTDESDFIESDDTKELGKSERSNFSNISKGSKRSRSDSDPDRSGDNLKELPKVNISRTSLTKARSPLYDLTDKLNSSKNISNDRQRSLNKRNTLMRLSQSFEVKEEKGNDSDLDISEIVTIREGKGNDVTVHIGDDDEVTFVDSKPAVIALSSEDEDAPISLIQARIKTEPQDADSTIKKYLQPKSYPNANVVYVAKHVRDNAVSKLESLREDSHNVRYLMDNMEVRTLPDRGAKLLARMAALETEVKQQAERVANMIVEPDKPSAKDIANDGFGEKGLSWDDIQAASNKVQPKMFGKQAMSTHLAERNHILERLRDLHESLRSRPPDSQHAPPPRSLRATLMPHQTHALAWLQWRETQSPRGGILADDMGLGKTLTMISLVASSKEGTIDEDEDDGDRWNTKENSKLASGGTLVVCPASLLQQWGDEVGRHCSAHALSVCLHHGPQRSTQPHRLASHDMVVTTYNIVSRDLDKKGVLMRVRWSRIILDEAHIVRNHKSLTAGAVAALEGSRRWCLTGTPVQNKDIDVFALLKFLRCTPFDELQMWKKWIDNKSSGGQERLSTIMRCLLLRRTKTQLQERGALACLPSKTMHQLDLVLSKEEMNVYQKVLVFSKTLFAQFLHQRAEKQDMAEGFLPRTGKDDAYTKMHKRMVALHGAKPVKSHEILVLLLRLRQLCCHCGLIAAMLDAQEDGVEPAEDPAGLDLLSELQKLSIDEEKETVDLDKEEEQDGGEEGTSVAEAIRSVLSPSNPVFDLQRPSSKIREVLHCLNKNVFPLGEKAVVVSQWTSVLDLVERELKAAGVKCRTLSGRVPVPARPDIVKTFNDPHSKVQVLLLSLCAGGVGLNLCGANHLLLLDPHWNPQLEEQAQDRIYRVTQTRPVHIYKFVCTDTVEASIKRLQQVKLDLANAVLTGARASGASKLTIEDLKVLFNMGQ